MSQEPDPRARGRLGRLVLGVGAVARRFVQAASGGISAGSDRANGPVVPPETRRAQRPQDYRP